MDGETMYEMFRLLAIAKYDERYVIPTAHAEQAHALEELATECSLDYEGGPGMMGESGPFGEGSGELTPVAVENFQMLKERQTSDTIGGGRRRRAGSTCSTGTARAPREGSSPSAARETTSDAAPLRATPGPTLGAVSSPSPGRRSRSCWSTRPTSSWAAGR